jgi:hypothetical protein
MKNLFLILLCLGESIASAQELIAPRLTDQAKAEVEQKYAENFRLPIWNCDEETHSRQGTKAIRLVSCEDSNQGALAEVAVTCPGGGLWDAHALRFQFSFQKPRMTCAEIFTDFQATLGSDRGTRP